MSEHSNAPCASLRTTLKSKPFARFWSSVRVAVATLRDGCEASNAPSRQSPLFFPNSRESAPWQESSTSGSPIQPLLGVGDDSGTQGIALIVQRATNRREQGRRLAAKAVK